MLVNEILIYLRKSRKDLEFFNESIEKTLERHQKTLQEFATKVYGSPIPEENILKEVVSGDTIADRPQMQKLLSLIEDNKYKAVLVVEVERLARGNTIDQGIIAQTFEYTNTLIITPEKIYDLSNDLDRSFFEDGLYQSRKYLLYTKKILSRGRFQSVKEGKFVGSITPYGYDKEKIKGEKGFKLIINPQEAEVVKLIFNMYIDNNGVQIIANKLNSMSIKPKKGIIWTSAMVRNILINDTLNGNLTWNKRKTISTIVNGKVKKTNPISNDYFCNKGLHEAIIDDETWNKAQQKMRQNHRAKPSTEIKNQLAGIVKCKICGRNMIRRPYNNGYKDTLMCPLPGCNTSSDLELVESRLIEELKNILNSYKNDYIDKKQDKKQNYDVLIHSLEQDIDDFNKKLEKIYVFFEDGTYDREEFNNRRNDIKLKIEEKKKSINTLLIEKQKKDSCDYSLMIPKLQNVLNLYNESEITIKEKNELLKSVIDECYYYKQNGGRWDKDNIKNFVLEIKLKI